jgi:hypothetical protein
MKTFIRTITVITALNLTMISFAQAEYATEEDTVASVDEDLVLIGEQPLTEPAARKTGEADIAKGSYDVKYNRKTVEVDNPLKRAYNYIYSPYTSSATNKQTSGSGAVLVIPSVEMKDEEFAAIMEDLNVMSRIFDKKLGPQHEHLSTFTQHERQYFDYAFSPRDKRVTESIYLGGFGVMFLTSVNFPLLPPPKIKEEKKVEEDVDTVWEQTKKEITTSKKAKTNERQWWATSQAFQQQRQVQVYNTEKIEELKRTLTKALKHAANIRGLKGDEWVTVVVKGSAPAAAAKITNARLLEDGKIITRLSKKNSGSSSPTFLTIRAKKSDIDAFSKKELDDAEFRKRVQIITY